VATGAGKVVILAFDPGKKGRASYVVSFVLMVDLILS
jgi:hypothetical protein